ncbi:antitoxin [Bacteroidia bacterium]|nr:antitoxin [Bacteroidia bacterium]
MEIEVKKYLFDIQQSIISIESYLGEQRDFNLYMSNQMLRRAVEREFEIIGEAINRIEKISPEIEISQKKQIIGMRNRVIHGYDKIDDAIVWGTIVRHLPVLKTEIDNLLKKETRLSHSGRS